MSSTAFTWAAVGAIAASIVLGPLVGEYGSFHYAHLGLAALFFGSWLRSPATMSAPVSPRAWKALLAVSLVWLEAASHTAFASFTIVGVDFSIFDWMVANGWRGHFGHSPIYAVQHLGVHSSFVLALLVPLHALVHTPLWLVTVGPLTLWAGLFPLRRLVERAAPNNGAVLLAASLAYVASPQLGRLVAEGLRIEGFIPLGTLWFLVGWTERRRLIWLAALALLFCSKEDSTLYVGSFAAASVAFDRERRAEAGVLLLACIAWLGVYSQLIQPALTGKSVGYVTFWHEFGTTPGGVLTGMATHPLAVVKRLFSSGGLEYFAPLLFLPWLSWRAAAGLAPTVFLLGTSSYDTMHRYHSYYPLPLVAFALFGVLEVMRTRPARGWMTASMLALCLFPLFGFGYARVRSFDPARLRDVAMVRDRIASAPRVCGQTMLFPHLGYPADLQPLTEISCGDQPGTWIVASEQFNPWPLSREALVEAIARWRATRPVTEVGPFVVVAPATPQ